MPVIQKMTRFDQSMIWSLLHRFYAEAGPEAWSSNIVPQRSTSNAFCADTYAAIVAAFFKELAAEGNSKPPLVIELGGRQRPLRLAVPKPHDQLSLCRRTGMP